MCQDEETRAEALAILDESSCCGSVQSSYLLWEKNHHTAVRSFCVHKYTVATNWPSLTCVVSHPHPCRWLTLVGIYSVRAHSGTMLPGAAGKLRCVSSVTFFFFLFAVVFCLWELPLYFPVHLKVSFTTTDSHFSAVAICKLKQSSCSEPQCAVLDLLFQQSQDLKWTPSDTQNLCLPLLKFMRITFKLL